MQKDLGSTILETSRAVVFRRLASDKPEDMGLIYLSPNIAQFGYRTEEFLNGRLMFKDIMHPGDHERTIREIREFTRQGVDEYKQTYRIVTRSGDVRWVEDQTSVVMEENSGRLCHQGVITDISDSCRELHLAGEIQCGLLPVSAPEAEGLDIAGKSLPFDHLGGDLYDFAWEENKPDSPVSIMVGDVSGHGADSAIIGVRASGYLRMGGLTNLPATETVRLMNRDLTAYLSSTGHFLTLIYLTFSTDRRCVKWVRAGHDAAFRYDPVADGFTWLRGEGMALGVDEDQEFKVNTISGLTSGQVFAIGTDGICESLNKEGEMFGSDRVKAVIRENASGSAQEILDSVFDAHAEFTKGMRRFDDLTLVIVKIN